MSSSDSNPEPSVENASVATSSENSVQADSSGVDSTAAVKPSQGGPLNLEQIRRLRQEQTPGRDSRRARPANAPPSDQTGQPPTTPSPATASPKSKDRSRKPREGDSDDGPRKAKHESQPAFIPRVEVPNIRQGLPSDLENELSSALADVDFDSLLVGDPSVQVGRQLEEGQRYPAKVLKIHHENVFLSLGGPDEGVIPLLQFSVAPKTGDQIECLVRSFNREDGLYELSIPGEAVNVSDWSDLEEGAVVEARVESANTGGLEAVVGSVRGFIPLSQIADYRVETPADYVGQKLLCVVTEANPRRGNLVLSHRAVLERDKEEKKKERFAKLEVGQTSEGIVRKVMDFGAFVDIGGLDGLIHVSQLSWEKIGHPSEVVKEGDKVQVRIDKIDPETGRIGLSYRALQDNPWNGIDAKFPIGSVVRGTVSRLANFGAFVKLTTGVEGLVHISELAHRRLSSVQGVVKEGDEVDVKILSVDREAQKVSLSLKQAQAPVASDKREAEPEIEEPRREPTIKARGPLKGGFDRGNGGEAFGLKW